MADVLFVTWDGGGNVPPALGLAAELSARGHRVRVQGHRAQAGAVARAGLEYVAFPHVREFVGAEPNPGGTVPATARLVAMFTDRTMGADVVAEAARVHTDLVVVDCMLVAAMRAVADAGLPYVSLEHLFDGYLRKGWLRGPVGVAARLKGLRPVSTWNGAAAALVATLPELDPGAAGAQPANLHWTGPVLDLPEAPRQPGEPTVLISLSTFGYPGMERALQTLVDATAGLRARVVITTGPAIDPAGLHLSANHEVHRYVPHDELLPSTTLLIGHGGHATTVRALAHDVPMLVMPMHPLLDQPLVGRAVQDSGAGRTVSKRATPGQVRPLVEELLADGPHRAAAARLGALVRAARGTMTGADHVEALLPDAAGSGEARAAEHGG